MRNVEVSPLGAFDAVETSISQTLENVTFALQFGLEQVNADVAWYGVDAMAEPLRYATEMGPGAGSKTPVALSTKRTVMVPSSILVVGS